MSVAFDDVAIFVGCLAPSVVLHELAHGVAAYACGDDTAKNAGRLTVNPVRHVDPFGTLLLPAILALTSVGIFGYAKPVPVRPSRMRHPRNHAVAVAMAGPATNLALSVLAALVLRVSGPSGTVWRVVATFGVVNVLLGVFNLLPIPPLDGSAVVERFLPRRLWPRWLRVRQYSMGVLVAVMLLAPGLLNRLFERALDAWSSLV